MQVEKQRDSGEVIKFLTRKIADTIICNFFCNKVSKQTDDNHFSFCLLSLIITCSEI